MCQPKTLSFKESLEGIIQLSHQELDEKMKNTHQMKNLSLESISFT